ncbi:hypothetical protein, partial [uncultured Sphingomonas sp.]|uniref:hypothetical protein n=1 Tax=uncultured Sphingomonas sp. TaxID=158754 RepID=UPI0025D21340
MVTGAEAGTTKGAGPAGANDTATSLDGDTGANVGALNPPAGIEDPIARFGRGETASRTPVPEVTAPRAAAPAVVVIACVAGTRSCVGESLNACSGALTDVAVPADVASGN